MISHIDNFQGKISTLFQQLILSTAYLLIGRQSVVGAPMDASVALTIAPDVTTEPISLRELLPAICYRTQQDRGMEKFQHRDLPVNRRYSFAQLSCLIFRESLWCSRMAIQAQGINIKCIGVSLSYPSKVADNVEFPNHSPNSIQLSIAVFSSAL